MGGEANMQEHLGERGTRGQGVWLPARQGDDHLGVMGKAKLML